MKLTRALLAALLAALRILARPGSRRAVEAPGDSWPTYNGDYSGRRYSPLDPDQSNRTSHRWRVAWAFRTNTVPVKSTPLMVNGILYFTVPDHVWAIDARTGREIWHYRYTSNGGDHIGNRGVGMYKDWLYFETPDCHLVCLNAKDGKERWKVELGDVKLGYFATMAPLVIRNHVIVGVSGDVTDLPGYLDSRDPETGKPAMALVHEPKPGEPGSETWPKNGDAITHGGGMTWMTGTYDPELNLLYWGTGNPNPVLAGEGREGDNLYTCSIVALERRHRQAGLVFPAVAARHARLGRGADADAVRRRVSRASRASCSRRPAATDISSCSTGKTGEHLLTTPFIETNWSKGINAAGQPDSRQGERSDAGWRAGVARIEWRDQLALAEFRSADRSVLRQRAAHVERLLSHGGRQGRGLGRARSQSVRANRCSKASITRPARSGGSTRSVPARDRPVS